MFMLTISINFIFSLIDNKLTFSQLYHKNQLFKIDNQNNSLFNRIFDLHNLYDRKSSLKPFEM